MTKLTGHGRPSNHTVGQVGQHYEDLNTGDIYECRIASRYSPTHGAPVGGYVWELRAKGEDIEEIYSVAGDNPGENNSSQLMANYYTAAREWGELDHESINTNYILGLYNALLTQYPDKIRRDEVCSDDRSFTNYVYTISTGDYNISGAYAEVYGPDPHIKKPKYLVLSGIHGLERNVVFSTYQFIRDALAGRGVSSSFIESTVLCIMPVGNPSGFDAFTRTNAKGVDLNRNFDWNWEKASDNRYGTSAASENETQAIVNWLKANLDADLFIDLHNSGATHEVSVILGLPDNDAVNIIKKTALRGIDRIIPYWRDEIGYTSVEGPLLDGTTAVQDVIYSYSASISVGGGGICYATDVLGIPSIAIEAVVFNGDYSVWLENKQTYPPETIAMGAEILGNILIECYEQSLISEANEMTKIDNRLEALVESMNSVGRGFRTESGTMVLDTDMLPTDGNSKVTVRVPCSNGAKTVDLHPDSTTLAAIRSSQGMKYFGSILANFYAPEAGMTGMSNTAGSLMSTMTFTESVSTNPSYNYGWLLTAANNISVKNDDGFTFPCNAVKAGTYNWIAYYWND